MHLALKAYQELLLTVNEMDCSQDENIRQSSNVIKSKVLTTLVQTMCPLFAYKFWIIAISGQVIIVIALNLSISLHMFSLHDASSIWMDYYFGNMINSASFLICKFTF